MRLVIGNKNYSSWSLRPWLLLRHLEVPFTEERVALYRDDSRPLLLARSPSGKVPVLIDEGTVVWDSLAICEYVAERFPGRGAWPEDGRARAHARSASAEMHSGFAALRERMPMNCRGRSRRVPMVEALREDVERVQALWRECRARFGAGGPWLFGRFSIADAMFAPVVCRFVTYDVGCDDVAAAYVATMRGHPALQEWLAAAEAESEVIEASEVGKA